MVIRDICCNTSVANTSVDTSGCIQGDGTSFNPVFITLASVDNLDSSIVCTNSGLADHVPTCYDLDNGIGGIGADVKNPTQSEILAFISASGLPIPFPGDVINYQSPSGTHVAWDVCRDVVTGESTLVKREEFRYFIDENNNGNSGSTKAISWSITKANQKVTLNSSGVAFTFNSPCSQRKILLHMVQSDSTPTEVTWPGNVVWAGTPPQPAVGSGVHSIFEFYFDGQFYHGLS